MKYIHHKNTNVPTYVPLFLDDFGCMMVDACGGDAERSKKHIWNIFSEQIRMFLDVFEITGGG